MKRLFCIIFFLTLISPAFAEEFNAGFVQGLWYDKDTVFADTPTRIYVAIRNNTGADLTGTVEFFDNGERIDRVKVSALDGRIIESWADWSPSFGEHTISASLSRTELHQIGTSTQAIEVVSTSASDTIFVDHDTDKDGVGNKEDTDDDGDGISDRDEKTRGTDPLDATDPAPEVIDTEYEKETSNSDEGGSKSETISPDSTSPQGLERYFGDNGVSSVFSSITNTVNDTKKVIDNYRESRNSDVDNSTNITSEDNTDNASLGKATSSNSSDPISKFSSTSISQNTVLDSLKVADSERNQVKDSGLLTIMANFGKLLLDSLYTFSLFLISIYLSNPVVVQITLLMLILILIYKVTKRLGSRQNH